MQRHQIVKFSALNKLPVLCLLSQGEIDYLKFFFTFAEDEITAEQIAQILDMLH